ncbi:TetR/AcrR family transcriptional regulator [Streptomonospora sp. PA3]|uniref:TetR/AcrR family transcriptional regulator n=1 Tax=Streptomonospora sp. PA3 TaxID=2607326 RepID=UPI0012DCFBE8|nr:TetR/AcrR family transcriptional regulator [Streptomonospora sp. PA3]MUL44239.1 TetR/AcrR family transcriptional regulator [Streptomonospora sp. PA3]
MSDDANAGGDAAEPAEGAAVSARGQATRARLLAGARAAILEGGGTLEVAAVARRAGVSAGLLYRYFAGKDGLVAAVVDDFYDSYDGEVFTTRLDGALSWPEREHARLRREIDFLCDAPLGRMIVGRRLREPAAAQTDAQRLARQIDIAARSIAKAQREGELDGSFSPRLAAAATLGAFRELMAEALSGDADPPRAELHEAMWRVGSSLLLHSPASDSSSSR